MKYKILVVDDEPVNLRLLERLFRRHYEVVLAASGIEGIRMLELHDIALIISDQRMPGMSGIEFLKNAAELRPNTVRIILTGYTDINDLVEVVNSGVVYKYLTKPWINDDLVQTVARGLEHYEAYKNRHEFARQIERLEDQADKSRSGFLNLITDLIGTVDVSMIERGQRIADLAVALGRWVNLDEEQLADLDIAAKFCELERLSFQQAVTMSVKEKAQEISKKDTFFWADRLNGIPKMEEIALAIRFQHERFDGTGSPQRLAGDQIPIGSRILAIAKAYVSLTFGQRDYEPTRDAALTRLQSYSGKIFDPELLRAFKDVCRTNFIDAEITSVLPESIFSTP